MRVHEKPDWRAAERKMWEEAAAAPPSDDLAMQSLQAEAQRSLPIWAGMRRVFATATAP